MSVQTAAYEQLPEDLAPLPWGRGKSPNFGKSPVVRISNTSIAISRAALAMIGSPAYLTIELGEHSRMLALRPSDPGVGLKVKDQARGGLVGMPIGRLGMPRNRSSYSRQFEPRLVEGALLIGPLPAAKP